MPSRVAFFMCFSDYKNGWRHDPKRRLTTLYNKSINGLTSFYVCPRLTMQIHRRLNDSHDFLSAPLFLCESIIIVKSVVCLMEGKCLMMSTTASCHEFLESVKRNECHDYLFFFWLTFCRVLYTFLFKTLCRKEGISYSFACVFQVLFPRKLTIFLFSFYLFCSQLDHNGWGASAKIEQWRVWSAPVILHYSIERYTSLCNSFY